MYVWLPVDMLAVVDNNQIGDVCLTFWIIWLPIIDSLQNLCEKWVVSQVDIFDSLQNYLMYRDGSWNTCWLCCIWPFSNPCCLCCGSESRRIEKDSWYRSMAGGAVLVFLGIYLALYNFRGNFRIPLSCNSEQFGVYYGFAIYVLIHWLRSSFLLLATGSFNFPGHVHIVALMFYCQCSQLHYICAYAFCISLF